jgi:hypothetical protein
MKHWMDTRPSQEPARTMTMAPGLARQARTLGVPRGRRVGIRPLLVLLALLLACLPVVVLASPAFADTEEAATALATVGAPVLSVSGSTVHWHPVALESSYRVAISNDARGTADRVTRYLWVERTPGETQSYTPTLAPGETVYIGISADGGVTWSEQEATVTAPKPEPEPRPAVPVLSVSGDTVQWHPIGLESAYRVAISNDARGTADRVTRYLWVERTPGETQTYTPTIAPGETVYIGISADGGVTWSEQEATVTAPKPEPEPEPEPEPKPEPEPEPILNPTAPVLSVSGSTISWTAIPGAVSYELATILNPTTTRNTTYSVVTGTSVTPPAVPGQTVSYGLAANTLAAQGPWAREVSIAYPESPEKEPLPGEGEPPPPPPTGKIIGTNDGAGWGTAAAQTILAGHITWNRVEMGMESNTLAASLSDGFHVLAIIGNVGDGTPLSQIDPTGWASTVVSQLQANPGIAIAEAGNEMYLKGNVANPVRYGQMYLAAVNAMKAAGIHTRLLFNMLGNYPSGSWSSPGSWSRDETGGGWLRDAVAGVPGLASAILANGLSTHPYGALGENHEDTNGVNAVAAQESVAKTVLGSTPPVYITEFGYSLSNCGANDGACSQQEQASKMRSAYKILLADPHVAGIWWYQSHDDGTGSFGYMNNDNSTRPSFETLASIAAEQGQ